MASRGEETVCRFVRHIEEEADDFYGHFVIVTWGEPGAESDGKIAGYYNQEHSEYNDHNQGVL